jgi:hypothetical protein
MNSTEVMNDLASAYPETRQFDYFRKQYIKGTHVSQSSEFHGTVKIHGSNISILFTNTPDSYQIRSRNRVLSADSDLYDCYKTLSRIQLHELADQVSQLHNAPWDELMIVGEWAGKGIQKGVGVCSLDKFFTIFNISIDKKWQDIRKFRDVALRDHRVFNIYDFPSYTITIDLTNLNDVDRADKQMESWVNSIDEKCPVAAYFGVDGPGEGLVFTHHQPTPSSWLSNFKVKGPSHQIVRKTRLDVLPPDFVQSIRAFVEYVITEERLDQGLSYLEEMQIPVSPKSTGDYIRWVVLDALKEEGHMLEDLNLKEKDVKQALTNIVRDGWKVRLKASQRQDL